MARSLVAALVLAAALVTLSLPSASHAQSMRAPFAPGDPVPPAIVEAYERLPNAPLDPAAAELDLVERINALRVAWGEPPLVVDQALVDLARARSADMAERNFVSHEIPGVGYGPRWAQSQIAGGIYVYIGENLGLSPFPNEMMTQTLLDAWVQSPTHLENLVRPQFKRVGIGVVEAPGPVEGMTRKFVTQYFADSPQPLARA
jgi:uncharacterized protein YkwD